MDQVFVIRKLTFNKERLNLTIFTTIKNRSLSGVEKDLSEVEYISAPFSTIQHLLLSLLRYCDLNTRATAKIN